MSPLSLIQFHIPISHTSDLRLFKRQTSPFPDSCNQIIGFLLLVVVYGFLLLSLLVSLSEIHSFPSTRNPLADTFQWNSFPPLDLRSLPKKNCFTQRYQAWLYVPQMGNGLRQVLQKLAKPELTSRAGDESSYEKTYTLTAVPEGYVCHLELHRLA